MSKEIEITKAQAFEIDPTKKYIIVLPRQEITQADAAVLNDKLKEWGADSVSVIISDPSEVKVVQL